MAGSRTTGKDKDEAMLAALRDTVVGLPEGSPARANKSSALSPPAQPRRATSDQTSPSAPQHGHSQSTSHAAAFAGRHDLPPVHARSTSTNALPMSSSSSRDPFADGGGGRRGRGSEATSGKDKKKGSRHADAIDKLDPSNFWGGMLHHESAYDAAAPSRNIQTSRGAAPMGAFNDSTSHSPARPPLSSSSSKLSALASRTLEKMGSIKFADDTRGGASGAQERHAQAPHSAPAATPGGEDSYFDVLPTIPASSAASPGSASLVGAAEDVSTPRGGRLGSSSSGGGVVGRGLALIRSRSRSRERKSSAGDKGRLPGVGSMPAEEDYYNARAKDKKNALANAWGVADPEPFEDFSAMAAAVGPRGDTGLASSSSSIWNGAQTHVQPLPVPMDRKFSSASGDAGGGAGSAAGDETRKYALTESYAGEGDGGEEILAPTDLNNGSYGTMPSAGGAGVKRSKSLMQRIRNMRENPNVPLAPEGKPLGSPGSNPGTPPYHGSSSLPSSASYSTFAAAQQQPPSQTSGRRGFFNRQASSRSDLSATDFLPGPSPSSEGSFVVVPPSAENTPRKQSHPQATHGRTRSRSDLMPVSASNGAIAALGAPVECGPAGSANRDKSLPRLPHENAGPPGEDAGDPFADAPEEPLSPVRRPSENHLRLQREQQQQQQQQQQGTRPIGRTRSPVPPPAPIDLPGQESHLYPQRFADAPGSAGSGSGGAGSNGGGGGGAQLGRKGSLMKRVLGRG